MSKATQPKQYIPLRKRERGEKADRIYEQIREQLEAEHWGKIVAIDLDTGEYFIDDDVLEATMKARSAHPGCIPYVKRIGYPYVWRVPWTR
jgi:hypothetical protein